MTHNPKFVVCVGVCLIGGEKLPLIHLVQCKRNRFSKTHISISIIPTVLFRFSPSLRSFIIQALFSESLCSRGTLVQLEVTALANRINQAFPSQHIPTLLYMATFQPCWPRTVLLSWSCRYDEPGGKKTKVECYPGTRP